LTVSATRHNARTCEYDKRPAAKCSVTTGNPARACATASWARAVEDEIANRIDNQCTHDRIP
jgi:hypothetical protein